MQSLHSVHLCIHCSDAYGPDLHVSIKKWEYLHVGIKIQLNTITHHNISNNQAVFKVNGT